MGLAPYGRPVYHDLILEKLHRPQARRQLLARHGVLQLLPGADDDQSPVPRPVRRPAARSRSRCSSRSTWTSRRASSRSPKRSCCGSAAHLHEKTRLPHLVLAGGVALNCVANGKLLREGPFDDIWIQPAAGDAGGALGAALFVWHQLLDKPREITGHDSAKRQLPRAEVQRREQSTGCSKRPAQRASNASTTRPTCSITSPA